MTENAEAYFQQLAESGYQPLLHRVTGTIRIEVAQDDGAYRVWRIVINHGAVAVYNDPGDADCVITGREDELKRILAGQDSFAAAYIRGAITVTGDHTLAQNVRRFSPPALMIATDQGPEKPTELH